MLNKFELFHGDCLQVMKQFPDNYFDACVTDPPYGIGSNNIIPGSQSVKSVAKLTDYKKAKWDIKQPNAIKKVICLSKKNIIFGGNFYTDVLSISRGWIVWDKDTYGSFADGELIWTDQDFALKIFEYTWSGMRKQKPETRYHPTQKPVVLIAKIIEFFTQPNDLIIDPFMGSGTTGVACAQLGRRFVGIELDADYFEIARKRIENAYAQPTLFEAVEEKQEAEQLELLS